MTKWAEGKRSCGLYSNTTTATNNGIITMWNENCIRLIGGSNFD
jgi:hypothetical protein